MMGYGEIVSETENASPRPPKISFKDQRKEVDGKAEMNQVFHIEGRHDNQSLRQRIRKTEVIKKIEEMLMVKT